MVKERKREGGKGREKGRSGKGEKKRGGGRRKRGEEGGNYEGRGKEAMTGVSELMGKGSKIEGDEKGRGERKGGKG